MYKEEFGGKMGMVGGIIVHISIYVITSKLIEIIKYSSSLLQKYKISCQINYTIYEKKVLIILKCIFFYICVKYKVNEYL